MANEQDQPDWSQLPANPRGFFALPPEFERKDLKRAYNRLIRVYKPEKHPAEFQQIRGAYEQLDRQLRYGQSVEAESQTMPNYEWEAHSGSPSVESTSGSHPPAQEPQAAVSLPLHERLSQEPPLDLYQELTQKRYKDPYDYYALAVLSDVVDRKNPHQFAKWLLLGLQQNPSEHGLLQLMRDFLREQPSPSLANLLVACSKAVPTDNFYPLTEPAWENLLREANFDFCLATLKQCEGNLCGIGIGGQLIFMIRMLRFALWRDKSDWKDRSLDFIEENYEQIPAHMEFELDLLSAAHLYIASRERFLNGNPLRQQIDQAMESYFTLDQVQGDQAILQCQLAMLDNTGEVLAAFPPDNGDEECQAMYTLWDWLSSDVADRYGAQQPQDVNTNLWVGRCQALLKQCRAHTKGSRLGWTWQIVMIIYLCFRGLLYFALPVLLCGLAIAGYFAIFSDDEGVAAIFFLVVLPVIAGVFATIKFNNWLQSRIWYPYCERQGRKNYLRFWRRELIDFLDRSQLNFHMTTQMIAHAASDDLDTWVAHFMQQDYGLAVFATARRFLV